MNATAVSCLVTIVATAVVGCASSAVGGDDAVTLTPVGLQPEGGWTIADTTLPLDPKAERPAGEPSLSGTVEFLRDRVAGPPPIGCSGARYELVVTPAEGLFQGSLPAPAEQSASAMGITHLPVMTLRVTCDSGAFDYHLIAPGTLLLGLDGVARRLENRSTAETPEAVVQRLLTEHMTHDMGFTPALVAPKRAFFTTGLNAAIDAYFALPLPEDEVPPIDGDPITSTQEYPSRFTLNAAVVDGAATVVPVVFSDGVRTRRVDFVLARDAGRWRVDDLRYEDHTTFRELLRPASN
jgi:hypothetical protein